MSEPWDIDPPNEAGKLRIENACCHEEIKRQAAEIERLRAALRRATEDMQHLIDNDPDEPITDAGQTLIDLWRVIAGETIELARAALEERT